MKYKNALNYKYAILQIRLLLLVVGSSWLTSAVAQINIQGVVTDITDNVTLPFVHITFGNQRYGTTSNKNGAFLITIPDEFQNDTLVFSYLGYATQTFKISELREQSDLCVELAPQAFDLVEIIVKPLDALKLVQLAIDKIPQNNFTQDALLTGFYRESIRQNFTDTTNLFAEGIIQVYKESYLKRRIKRDKVKLIKGFRKKMPYQFLGKNKVYGLPVITQGAFLPILLDIVKSRTSFLGKWNLSSYKFKHVSSTVIDNDVVHIIQFEPKGHAYYEGELYIHETSKAFIKAIYKFSPYGLTKFNDVDNIDLTLLSRAFEVNFAQFQEKWYLQNAHVSQRYSVLKEAEPLDCEMSYTTTEVNIENIKKPRWKNQYDRDEAFIEKSDIVEKDYWKGYNILLKEN